MTVPPRVGLKYVHFDNEDCVKKLNTYRKFPVFVHSNFWAVYCG